MRYVVPNQYDFSTIKLLRMCDNKHGDLPFFARLYGNKEVTRDLHGHEYTQINYIYRGGCQHIFGNCDIKYGLKEGDVFIVPPYVPHRIISHKDTPIKIIEIEFNPEMITQEFTVKESSSLLLDILFLEPYLMSSKQGDGPKLNLTGNIKSGCEQMMLEIVDEFMQRRSGFELFIKSNIISLVIKLARVYQLLPSNTGLNIPLERHHESIIKAIEYIRNNYHEKISLEDVSKIAMLSTSYFCYIFKNITNRTVIDYINELRIKKSIEQLRTSLMSIGEICFSVGFNNISHFNHLFKKYVGVSPSVFRKNAHSKKQ